MLMPYMYEVMTVNMVPSNTPWS